jgi:hypothetical protein
MMKGKLLALTIAATMSLVPLAANAISPEQQQAIDGVISAQAGISGEELVQALLAEYPQLAEEVVASVMAARPAEAAAVAQAATQAGVSAETVTASAISVGIDPASVAPATAAGTPTIETPAPTTLDAATGVSAS